MSTAVLAAVLDRQLAINGAKDKIVVVAIATVDGAVLANVTIVITADGDAMCCKMINALIAGLWSSYETTAKWLTGRERMICRSDGF